MSKDCIICAEKLNNSTRLPVSCPYCEFTACRTCCETYVIGETSSKCMNTSCNREWTRQFITSTFTNVFITKKLKKRREEILFDIERSLLPSTQPQVERMIKTEAINRQIKEIPVKKKNSLLPNFFKSSQSYIHINGIKYLKLELIGKGGNGKVYKIADEKNKIYALKKANVAKLGIECIHNYIKFTYMHNIQYGKEKCIYI